MKTAHVVRAAAGRYQVEVKGFGFVTRSAPMSWNAAQHLAAAMRRA